MPIPRADRDADLPTYFECSVSGHHQNFSTRRGAALCAHGRTPVRPIEPRSRGDRGKRRELPARGEVRVRVRVQAKVRGEDPCQNRKLGPLFFGSGTLALTTSVRHYRDC